MSENSCRPARSSPSRCFVQPDTSFSVQCHALTLVPSCRSYKRQQQTSTYALCTLAVCAASMGCCTLAHAVNQFAIQVLQQGVHICVQHDAVALVCSQPRSNASRPLPYAPCLQSCCRELLALTRFSYSRNAIRACHAWITRNTRLLTDIRSAAQLAAKAQLVAPLRSHVDYKRFPAASEKVRLRMINAVLANGECYCAVNGAMTSRGSAPEASGARLPCSSQRIVCHGAKPHACHV